MSAADIGDQYLCLSCRKPFSSFPGKASVGLVCGHVICEACLVASTTDAAGSNDKCLLCFNPVTVDVVAPGAEAVSLFVDEFKGSSQGEGEATALRCLECSKLFPTASSAVFVCDGCPQPTPCCEDHAHIHAKANHALRSLRPFSSFPAECAVHARTPLYFFCVTCTDAVCPLCMMESHSKEDGHEVIKIEDARLQLKTSLETALPLLKGWRDNHHEGKVVAANALKQLVTERSKALEDVDAYFDRVIAAVEARRRAVKAQIDDAKQLKDTQLERQRFCEEATALQLSLGVELVTAAAQADNVMTMAKSCHLVDLQRRLELNEVPKPAEQPVLRFLTTDEESIAKCIAGAGSLLTELKL